MNTPQHTHAGAILLVTVQDALRSYHPAVRHMPNEVRSALNFFSHGNWGASRLGKLNEAAIASGEAGSKILGVYHRLGIAIVGKTSPGGEASSVPIVINPSVMTIEAARDDARFSDHFEARPVAQAHQRLVAVGA